MRDLLLRRRLLARLLLRGGEGVGDPVETEESVDGDLLLLLLLGSSFLSMTLIDIPGRETSDKYTSSACSRSSAGCTIQ